MKYTFWRSLFSLAILGYLIPQTAKAQIVPDNSLGQESSEIVPLDEQGTAADVIVGGAARGANLFHSFQEFNVSPDRSTFFSNPEGINSIFSRVTGTNISNINGQLGVLGSANLFLINPNGIFFGANAALNIQGSFFASSADSLLFDNDFEFSANDPQVAPLLDINIPIGLNFRDNPGDITINQTISGLLNGGTFALIGGNVSFSDSSIIVPGGRLELGGLSTAGTVNINEDGVLNFSDGIPRSNVSLNNTLINVAAEGGGSVNINARNFELLNGSNVLAGITPISTNVNTQGGDLIIDATDNVLLDGMESIFTTSIANNNDGIGNLGNTVISARNITFLNGGNISSLNSGQGNGSNIILLASEDIKFDGISNGFRAGIQSSILPLGVGNSGNITITSQNLFINNGATVFTAAGGIGNSGNITINAVDSISVQGLGESESLDGNSTELPSSIESIVSFGSVGDSEGINLTTNDFSLSDGGIINTLTIGRGNAGNVTINSGQTIIDGKDNIGGFSSSINSSVLEGEEGNGGNIAINTDSIFLLNGGGIESITNANGNAGDITLTATDLVSIDGESEAGSRSQINADVQITGFGNGGNINVSTTDFSLTNEAGLTSSSSGIGDAGSITITAINTFVADNSLIASNIGNPFETNAEGNVGSIQISAKDINLRNSGQIQAGLFSGATGGTGVISLNATESISFTGENSGIFSNNEVGSIGDASNAQLFAPTITFDKGAGVTANNFGQGNGGNVTIFADNLTLDRDNQITGSTDFGTGGIVNLQITEDLILRRGNEISAQAVNDANGGNLTIDTELIIAFPGNNDIIASADRGSGGNINIAAESLFGIADRPLNPFTNDINASSNFGLQGNIAINTPEVDPTTGLINLPASVGDASDQISQNPCQQGVGSEFRITGKGGLPPTVNESLNSESAQVDLIEPLPQQLSSNEEELNGNNSGTSSQTTKPSNQPKTPENSPAMGWVFNDRGEVTLTAHAIPGNKIQRSGKQYHHSCSSGISQ